MRKNIVGELRVNWAEDAKRIAKAREDVLVWPKFSNEDDDMAGNTWADADVAKCPPLCHPQA